MPEYAPLQKKPSSANPESKKDHTRFAVQQPQSGSKSLNERETQPTRNTPDEQSVQAPTDLNSITGAPSYNLSTIRIFPKLTVTPANDQYEQEADTVARQVVRQINGPTPMTTDSVQRKEHEDDEDKLQLMCVQRQASDVMGGMAVDANLENRIQMARGSGSPIPDAMRVRLENAFSADFSGVRIHANNDADALNRSVQARAFTTGQDIFFRRGEYNLCSSSGQEILAHELTHVVQQAMPTEYRTLQRYIYINDEKADPTEILVETTHSFINKNYPGAAHLTYAVVKAEVEKLFGEYNTPDKPLHFKVAFGDYANHLNQLGDYIAKAYGFELPEETVEQESPESWYEEYGERSAKGESSRTEEQAKNIFTGSKVGGRWEKMEESDFLRLVEKSVRRGYKDYGTAQNEQGAFKKYCQVFGHLDWIETVSTLFDALEGEDADSSADSVGSL